jgi:hypothetical protein
MDALDQLYQQPPIPMGGAATGPPGGSKWRAAWALARALRPGKGLMGRMLTAVVGSIIVGVVTNLPYLKLIVLWICQAILWIFGKPEMPEPVEVKLKPIVAKAKDWAGRHEIVIPPVMEPAPPAFAGASSDAGDAGSNEGIKPAATLIRAAAKVERKVQAKLADAALSKVNEEVHEKVEVVKQEARKLGDRMELAAGGFRDSMIERQRLAAERQAEAARIMAERRAEAERQALIQKAVQYKIPWKDRPIEALRDEVTAAEAEHAPNAQCPACRHPLRLAENSGTRRRCPRCRRTYLVRTARAMGPPQSGFPLFRPFQPAFPGR